MIIMMAFDVFQNQGINLALVPIDGKQDSIVSIELGSIKIVSDFFNFSRLKIVFLQKIRQLGKAWNSLDVELIVKKNFHVILGGNSGLGRISRAIRGVNCGFLVMGADLHAT